MMTNEFLIGAIRASRDLHPLVKTELEEILKKGRDRVIRGLECCQVDSYGDFENCQKCPYNEISVVVQECRTALSRDALKLLK